MLTLWLVLCCQVCGVNGNKPKHLKHFIMPQQQRTQSMPPFQVSTSLLVLLLCIVVPTTNSQSRQVTCPSDSGVVVTGYDTIESINLDMEEIFTDDTSSGPYEFLLCPDTTFTIGTVPLRPLLSACTFVCAAEGCVFDGGEQQVVIEGVLSNVTFEGIEFQNFTNSSIYGRASSDSAVLFDRCTWSNFVSSFVIEVVPDAPENKAMIVLIRESSVQNGVGGSLISNDGGLVRIENVTAMDLIAVGLVVTGNFAETDINGLLVVGNELTYVLFGTSNCSVTVFEAFVAENIKLSEVFFITDNSEMFVDTSSVINNQVERTTEEGGWTIGSANGTNTTLGMNNMRIEGNVNVQFCSSSNEGSNTFLSDSILMNNTGLGTSALVFAVNNSTFDVKSVIMMDNIGFTFLLFAFNESFATFRDNCMIGGSASSAAFMGEATQYVALGNFIDSLDTMGCAAPGPRLFKEDPGARCFNGGTNCSGTCEIMAEAEMCSITGATATPTDFGSSAPSFSPDSATPVPSAFATPIPSAFATPIPSAFATPIPSAFATPAPSFVIEPTTVPNGEPTNPPVEEPSSPPISEASSPPILSPVEPPMPTAPKPTPMKKPPLHVRKPPARPPPYEPYHEPYYKTFKKSKTSKTKSHRHYTKVSKGYYPYAYYKDPKGHKGSKGYFAYEYQWPPPMPYKDYSWQPPPHTHSHIHASNYHNGDYNKQRHWAGSNHVQATGNQNKRTWAAGSTYHSSINRAIHRGRGFDLVWVHKIAIL